MKYVSWFAVKFIFVFIYYVKNIFFYLKFFFCGMIVLCEFVVFVELFFYFCLIIDKFCVVLWLFVLMKCYKVLNVFKVGYLVSVLICLLLVFVVCKYCIVMNEDFWFWLCIFFWICLSFFVSKWMFLCVLFVCWCFFRSVSFNFNLL